MNNRHKVTEKENEEKEIKKFIEKMSKIFKKKEIEQIAKEEGFCKRKSKLTGYFFMCIYVFGIAIYKSPTYEQLAGLANVVISGLNISRQGFAERINHEAESFLNRILSMSVGLKLPETQELSELSSFKKVVVLDSTSFQVPQELAEYFPGTGGAGSKAGVKIQFGYDIIGNHFFYEIQGRTNNDNKYENNFVGEMGEGELLLKDLGYFNGKVFEDLDKQNTLFLSRLHSKANIYKVENNDLVNIDLLDLVTKVSRTSNFLETEVFLANKNHQIKVRLVIERVPEEIKNERLRKLKRKCQRERRPVTQRAKTLVGFTMFVTNIDSSCLAHNTLRALYSLRWQIELTFRTWKSSFHLAKVRCRKPCTVRCLLYAKFIFLFLSHKFIRFAKSIAWRNLQKEVSDHRAFNYLQATACFWLFSLVNCSRNLFGFLYHTFVNIVLRCHKQPRQRQPLPFKILQDYIF